MEEQFFNDLKELIRNKSKDNGYGIGKIKVKNKGIIYELKCVKQVSKISYYIEIERVSNNNDNVHVNILMLKDNLDKFPNFETLEQVFDYERELYDAKEKEELERSKRIDSMLGNVNIIK